MTQNVLRGTFVGVDAHIHPLITAYIRIDVGVGL